MRGRKDHFGKPGQVNEKHGFQRTTHRNCEATQEIRRLKNRKLADIPIIAMTANAFEEGKVTALKAGMNDHLAKPVQLDKLYEMMVKYL